MPELAIILVNYKRPADTVECIRSLRMSTYKDYEVTVVDNNSNDGSSALIRRECPEAVVIENPENAGFCIGNNIGLEKARSSHPRYFLLLNNDTTVDSEALSQLVEAFEKNPQVGVCGPKILYFDKPNLLWFAGGVLNRCTGRATHRGILTIDDGRFDRPGPCDYVTGCSLMFRSAVYQEIGGLDPDYFAYFEDADFCSHAASAGYGIFFVPSAKIFHKVSSTSGWDSPVYLYFTLRNRLLFLRKNSTPLRVLAGVPALIYFFGRQFVRLFIKWRNFPAGRAAWFGMIDGIQSSPGARGKGRLDTVKATG